MFESQFISTYPLILVASDEAGRGPLAGPVAAASVAVLLNSPTELRALLKTLKSWGVDDSKKMKPSLREIVAKKDLLSLGVISSVILMNEQTIDEINILAASLRGMFESAQDCVSKLKKHSVVWLIDGNKIPKTNLEWQTHSIVKGDSKSSLIGLASILAKVKRDQVMNDLHLLYPQYGFNQHAGYPTQAHRDSIAQFGPSPVHRKTFKGVREYL